MAIARYLTATQIDAVATADAQANNLVLPTYTELYTLIRRLAYPEANEALLLEDYRNIARNIIEPKKF